MKKTALIALLVGLFSGCSSVTVQRDYEESTDFSNLKTYAWQHVDQPKVGDPRIDNDLENDRVRRAVNARLIEKGFVQIDRANADFWVTYYVGTNRKLNASSMSFGVGTRGYNRYGGVGYNTSISEYEESILTVDILDSKDQKIIWRGIGTSVAYQGSDPKKATRTINTCVDRILKEFPPQK